MKKKIQLTVLLLTLFSLPILTSSAAAMDNYFTWKIGLSQMAIKNIHGNGTYAAETVNKTSADEDVTPFSLAYGNKLSDGPFPLRMEIELSFRSVLDYTTYDLFVGSPTIDFASSDLTSHTLFANLYLDLLPEANIVPYVSGGIGISRNSWESNVAFIVGSETTTGLAWNIGGGIGMKLNRRLMLDLSYRYIDLGEAELPDLLKIDDLTTNEIMLGLRLNF